jgi:hypothetical protein
MSFFLRPPFMGVSLTGDLGRIRFANPRNGEFHIVNYQHIVGGADPAVSFTATTPPVQAPRGFIRVEALFRLSGHIEADALPGYATAHMRLRVMATPIRSRFPVAGSVSIDDGPRFTAPAFVGGGDHFIGRDFLRGTRVRQDVRDSVTYLLTATVTSSVGVGGWAYAEATMFPLSALVDFFVEDFRP